MTLRHLAFFAALAAANPAASSAQLGGLVRKAKDAAMKKTDSSTSSNANLKPSSAFGPELTVSSLDAVLRGAAASQAKLDQVDQLNTELRQSQAKSDAAERGHDQDRKTYEDARVKQSQCWEEEWDRATNAEQQKMQQRLASDPTFRQKLQQQAIDAGRKSAALQAKGDTAGMRKLAMDMMKEDGMDVHADSESVRKTCGSPPPVPAFLADENAARAQARTINEHIRQLQDNAGTAGVAASGMDRQAYNLARERVVNWLHETKGGSAVQAFGNDERKLLEGKKSQITKLAKSFS